MLAPNGRPHQASEYFGKDNVFWWAAVLRMTPPSEEGSSKAIVISLQPVFLTGVLVPALQIRQFWPIIPWQHVGNYLQTKQRFATERWQRASLCVLSRRAAPVAGHLDSFQVQMQIAIIKPVVVFLPETVFLLCCVGNNQIWFALQQEGWTQAKAQSGNTAISVKSIQSKLLLPWWYATYTVAISEELSFTVLALFLLIL